MASIDDLVTVGNSVNKNVSQLIIAINDFTNAYSGVIGTAPITITGTTYSATTSNNWLIANYAGTVTITFPAATSNAGRVFYIKTVQAQAVNSASANIVPLTGGVPVTSILAATLGKYAVLVSDGSNWIIMQAN